MEKIYVTTYRGFDITLRPDGYYDYVNASHRDLDVLKEIIDEEFQDGEGDEYIYKELQDEGIGDEYINDHFDHDNDDGQPDEAQEWHDFDPDC